LRHIDGFMGLLSKRAAATLDETSKRYVQTVTKAAQQMGRLIDDLLSFSRMSRHELHVGRVDMRALFEECRVAVLRDAGERKIEWKVGELPEITGDAAMLQMALENLLSNAVKYTRTREVAEITFDSTVEPGAAETRFRVMDNGVGFDMQYAGKLFGVFQRLHRPDEFEGTGIGLANVQRIIHRHRGRVWAESSPGAGAAFFFTLPNQTTA
jgi:light-regulated signal transduction histidine kinase (bacteriophytochrome)